ncbi:helix-turn-helix domain-containing protein [Paraburkholderia bengalensis]|uniref:Helix-turn-helix domain-containing protein n=1 Tax=Paraburkholderia bengalensis TaxID=2747562 RepID=A0ABU8IL40_9BURK
MRLREVAGSAVEPQMVVVRAHIVMACLNGTSNKDVAVAFGVSEHTVSKWRKRFAAYGIDGLRDKPRPGAPKRVSGRSLQALVDIGCRPGGDRPSAGTVAATLGVSRSTVARIWRESHANTAREVDRTPHAAARGSPLEMIGIYLARDLKVVAMTIPDLASRRCASDSGIASGRGGVHFFSDSDSMLLTAVARVAEVRKPNRATDSILGFIETIGAASAGRSIHLLCFGERANWVEQLVSDSTDNGELTVHPFAYCGPLESMLERAVGEVARDLQAERELVLPQELFTSMRIFLTGDAHGMKADYFCWSILGSNFEQLSRPLARSDDFEAQATENRVAAHRSDLELAFDMAPVGLLVSRRRMVDRYNQAFCGMFGYRMTDLAGKSLELLYPSYDEFVHVGERALPIMRDTGLYSDERIMRRVDDSLFWCHVSGRAIDRNDPFAAAVWTFEDMSTVRRVTTELTVRERQIAQFLVNGRSSKQVAKDLNISHRTVEAHRARLMRKYDVRTTNELVAHLIGRQSA